MKVTKCHHLDVSKEGTKKVKKTVHLIIRSLAQLFRFYICFLEIINLNLTNFRATRNLHDR
jgi:hypothetical protein